MSEWDGGSGEPARNDGYKYRICRGCKKPIEAVIYRDESGKHNTPAGFSPMLALFGFCGCSVLRPIEPAGWRRLGDSEIDPNASAALSVMQPPYITTHSLCGGRLFPVLYWEPGKGWESCGELHSCTLPAPVSLAVQVSTP